MDSAKKKLVKTDILGLRYKQFSWGGVKKIFFKKRKKTWIFDFWTLHASKMDSFLRTFVWSSTINLTWQMAFTDATTEQFLCVPWCRREAIYQSASCPAKCCPAAAGSSRWPLASWRRRRPGTQGMVFGIYLLWCEASKIHIFHESLLCRIKDVIGKRGQKYICITCYFK